MGSRRQYPGAADIQQRLQFEESPASPDLELAPQQQAQLQQEAIDLQVGFSLALCHHDILMHYY